MKTTKFTAEQFEVYTEEILALAQYLECDPEDITAEAYGDIYTINGEKYLICDDDVADSYWDDELEYYIEECILPDLNKTYHMYFDNEKWKRDARVDGRGHSLNHYDGTEEVENINGKDYYIFRQN